MSDLGPLFVAPLPRREPSVHVRFDGPVYSPADDDARLTAQLTRIKRLMADKSWRTVQEIAAVTDDPENSISAQLRHLRKARFGRYEVKRRKREGTGATYEYQLGEPGAHIPPVRRRGCPHCSHCTGAAP